MRKSGKQPVEQHLRPIKRCRSSSLNHSPPVAFSVENAPSASAWYLVVAERAACRPSVAPRAAHGGG